jgi:hypothetical protein
MAQRIKLLIGAVRHMPDGPYAGFSVLSGPNNNDALAIRRTLRFVQNYIYWERF